MRPEAAGPLAQPGAKVDGYEAMGALRFGEVTLEPGEARSYVLALAILPEGCLM